MKKSLLLKKVKAIILCFSLLFIASFFMQICAQNVTGKVFRDFDANGQQTSVSPIEPAVAGVTVKAFNANGIQVGATTTLVDGTYSIAVGTTSPVRVEFSNFPSSYYSGPKGISSGTSVQFVKGGDTANFGINYPTDYCGTSPKLVTPCYVNGTPLNGGNSANDPFIVSVPYSPTGNGTVGTTSDNVYLSKGSEVGATWGMAYQRSSKFIFTSALLKRHSGFGSGGPGAIYKIDVSGGTQITTLFVDLKADLGVDVGVDSRNQTSAVDSLSKIKTEPNHDSTAFGNVGKMSLGSIEISDDEKTLWVINTFDKKLYELPIGSPAVKPTTKIAHTLPDPGCTNGVFRPWAIKFWRGKVYVGGVCTAEKTGGTNADLRAYIYSFIPGDANPDNFTQIISFPLNYPRGVTSVDGSIQTSAAWKPWIAQWSDITNPTPGNGAFKQTICPQPMLSDIEFDVDGSMVVGFMDRAGHQLGNKNFSPNRNDFLTYEGASAGDLLRIGFSNGVYILENNATVNGIVSGGNNQSPSQGPGNGEFYWQDMYSKNANKDLPSLASGSGHQEISLGGLALLSGNNEVVETVFDPVVAPRSGGIRWFDNTNGSSPRGYEVFGQDAGGQGATFGKANGLGDLELLCDSQPIEVGNRLWNDTNKNGIQDAGEPVLTGVTVELWKNGVKIETKTTDAVTGEFYFTGLIANSTDYEIRVPNTGGASKQTQLRGLMLTTAKAGTNNAIDSDATISGVNTYASIAFSTGNAGENNHTLDIGFQCNTPMAKPAGQNVSICEPTTTFDLPDAKTGTDAEIWSVITSPANPAAVINSTTGLVTGMTTNGKYEFVLTNTQMGCADTVSITRGTLSSAGADQTICSPATTAKLNASVTGQTWSVTTKPSGTTPMVAVDGSVTGMTAEGVYTFRLTQGNCFYEVQVIRKARSSAGSDIVTCLTTATLISTDVNDNWGVVTSPANPSSATVNAKSGEVTGMINSGIYQFVLTSANGCTDTVKVTKNVGVNLTVNDVGVCSGGILQLTANTIDTGLTFLWSGPVGFTSNQQNPSIANVSSDNLGVYSVTATASTGCSATATTKVFSSQNPVLTATSAAICLGGSGTISVLPTGLKYAWTGPSTFTSTLQTPTITNATDANQGTYSVTVTDGNTCISTATVVVTVGSALTVSPTSNSPVCVGTRLELRITGVTGATYLWTSPSGFTTTMQNPFTTNATNADNGVWTVVVENGNGCKGTGTTSVVINPSFTGVSATASAPGCTGENIFLNAMPTGAKSYEWSGVPTFSSTVQNPVITSSTAGTYEFTVKVTNANGCTALATASTAIYTAPAATVSSNSPVCFGNTINLAVITSGTKFAWTGPNNFTNSTQNPSISNAQALNDGIYTVVVTNSNSCNATATTMVVVNSQLNGGNDMSICSPVSTAQLTVIAEAVWSADPTNPVVATVDVNGKVSGMTVDGTYVFTITNANGCKDVVNIFRNGKLDAGDDVVICSPSSTAKLLKLNTGQTWRYFANGSTLPTPSIDANGNVTGVSEEGSYLFILEQEGITYCADTVAVIRKLAPNAGGDLTVETGGGICEPSKTAKLQAASVNQTWSVASNSLGFGTVVIDATGKITNMEINGIYTFVLTQGECTDSVQVERIAKPNAGNDVEICANITSVKLADAPTRMTWTSISTNPAGTLINAITGEVSGLTTVGEYKFILKNVGGCTDTVSIKTKAIPTFNATTIQTTCTMGTANPDAKLIISDFGGTDKYDYSEGTSYAGFKTFATALAIPSNGILVNNLVNPVIDRSYTVRVFNSSNCYTDKIVLLKTIVCECKADVCVPFTLKKTIKL